MPEVKEGAAPTQSVLSAALAAGWVMLQVMVSKKVADGKGGSVYEEVGNIGVPIPALEAFGITAELNQAAIAEAKKDAEYDGLPIYADEKLDWLFSAAVAQAKMQARNKLISGTATLKDGLKIAETFAELLAEGGRGNAEALKMARELRTSFAAFVQSLKKSAQTSAVLVGLFGNKQALSLQADDKKLRFKEYLTQYAETLSETDLTRYQKALGSIEEACAPGAAGDDF